MPNFIFWTALVLLFGTYAMGLWGILFSETVVDESEKIEAEAQKQKTTTFHTTAKRFGVVSLIISLVVLSFLYSHVTAWTFLKTVFVALTIGYWMWRISRSLS
jgi:hypothetical protein